MIDPMNGDRPTSDLVRDPKHLDGPQALGCSMLSRLTGPFREFGAFAGLAYLVDRLLGRVSSRLSLRVYELMVQPISDKPYIPVRMTKRLVIREIRRGDKEIERMPARPEIKESRYRQKAVCLGGYLDEKFVGYMWFCYKVYEEDEVRCTFVLPDDEAVFDFDFYVLPEYRMGIAFGAIWNGAREYLRERGIKRTFSRVTRTNLSSRRAHQRLGWNRVGRAVFLQLWQFELMVATLPPFVHASWKEEARARLRLRAPALADP